MITKRIVLRKLRTPKGLWVWVPVVLAILLMAVVSDVQRGIRFHLGHRVHKPFLYNVGEKLGYGGALLVSAAMVAGGTAVFLRRVKEDAALEEEMWHPDDSRYS